MTTINPETLLIEGLEHRTFTAEQFARIEPPACPVCGATVEIDRIDVTFNAEEEARQGRNYIPGMWRCPHNCNPRTGQRMHYSQSVSSGIGSGYSLECSCGFSQQGLTGDELAALRQEHAPPAR